MNVGWDHIERLLWYGKHLHTNPLPIALIFHSCSCSHSLYTFLLGVLARKHDILNNSTWIPHIPPTLLSLLANTQNVIIMRMWKVCRQPTTIKTTKSSNWMKWWQWQHSWPAHFLIKVAFNVFALELLIKVLLSVTALELFVSRPLCLDVELTSSVVSVETVVEPGVFGRSPTFRIPKKICKKKTKNR